MVRAVRQTVERRQGMSRLDARRTARRRAARRRRRAAVFAMLAVAVALVTVDFARGGTFADPPDVIADRPIGIPRSPASAPASDPSHPPPPSSAPPTTSVPSPPRRGAGTFTYAPGQGVTLGTSGTLLRYRVGVEVGSGQDAMAFATTVDLTLGDPRSWIAGRDVRMQRVPASAAADFTIYLATPGTTDRICAPLRTNGYASCRQGNLVVINLARWLLAVPDYGTSLFAYRQYAINHEVGHRLGHQHERCTGPGKLAPVMQQQTYGLKGCKANAWPFVNGRRYQGAPVA